MYCNYAVHTTSNFFDVLYTILCCTMRQTSVRGGSCVPIRRAICAILHLACKARVSLCSGEGDAGLWHCARLQLCGAKSPILLTM